MSIHMSIYMSTHMSIHARSTEECHGAVDIETEPAEHARECRERWELQTTNHDDDDHDDDDHDDDDHDDDDDDDDNHSRMSRALGTANNQSISSKSIRPTTLQMTSITYKSHH